MAALGTDRALDFINAMGGKVKVSMIGNHNGASKLAVMFWLALLGIVIYAAIKIVPLWMDYGRMKDTMAIKASVAQVLKDEEILSDLVLKAKELDLPLKAENFILQRDMERRKMTIKTAWDVEVHLFGDLYIYRHHFEPVVEENIMGINM